MLKFIQQFILHPRMTGAIVPSSKSLAQAMLEPIDFSQAEHIVELGPGTGALTKRLLRRMKKDAKLTAIELNQAFCERLESISDPRLTVINSDARYLSSAIKSADYVVSSLPLIGFNDDDRNKILDEIKKVMKRSYIQFHYSTLGERHLRENFNVTRKLVVKNFPPAVVYTAKLDKNTNTN